jgi:ribose-phosphate pyrophosphokinase
VAISAKLVANLLAASGVNRLVSVDLHSSQMQGFFDIPVDNLQGHQLLLEFFREYQDDDCVVVAPNVGSIQVARTYAAELGAGFAVIDRLRVEHQNECHTTLIGDVKGKKVLLADDICSTGVTLASAAKACHEKGAKQVFGAVTHGLCVGEAVNVLKDSPLEKLWITNSIPSTEQLIGLEWIKTISIAPLIVNAIR